MGEGGLVGKGKWGSVDSKGGRLLSGWDEAEREKITERREEIRARGKREAEGTHGSRK